MFPRQPTPLASPNEGAPAPMEPTPAPTRLAPLAAEDSTGRGSVNQISACFEWPRKGDRAVDLNLRACSAPDLKHGTLLGGNALVEAVTGRLQRDGTPEDFRYLDLASPVAQRGLDVQLVVVQQAEVKLSVCR